MMITRADVALSYALEMNNLHKVSKIELMELELDNVMRDIACTWAAKRSYCPMFQMQAEV